LAFTHNFILTLYLYSYFVVYFSSFLCFFIFLLSFVLLFLSFKISRLYLRYITLLTLKWQVATLPTGSYGKCENNYWVLSSLSSGELFIRNCSHAQIREINRCSSAAYLSARRFIFQCTKYVSLPPAVGHLVSQRHTLWYCEGIRSYNQFQSQLLIFNSSYKDHNIILLGTGDSRYTRGSRSCKSPRVSKTRKTGDV
jgi:hypothetical protein